MKEIYEMLGKVFTDVYTDDDETLIFENSNVKFEFYHRQECCEDVYIESIVGDLQDLVGSPILLVEESSSDDDNIQWTFYKFATIKGYVDVRWFGESNGFYSTSVDLRLIKK